ncbi:MAG TPA: glycosyltransferase family 1 protein [Streptosporangiaceae bacterium]|nr:glycosyltransferase family 1 protein [Streptosporangiaceae bacterium]
MRIAYVTESFPPVVNGVAITATRVAEHLVRRGHQPLVIAPEPAPGSPRPDDQLSYPVARMPSVGLPVYPDFRFGLPGPRIRAAIAEHNADLVHLAGPVMFGASAGAAARHLRLPVVAVYATDMAAYARAYHLGRMGESVAWRLTRRTHNAVDLTLSPSTATAADLVARGFERVSVWGRGVDTERFDPARRSQALRAQLAPAGEVIVGYVGRLAAEKRLDLLTEVARLPGTRLVIVGAGPTEAHARKMLPGAVFAGQSQGDELARMYASLDIFVHSGPHETFGNTLQEAAASGLPVVAPAAGGPLDLVEDGVTGFLVTPGDSGALADAVGRLASDWQLRTAQGHAARRSMLDRTWPARGDELIGHYEAVLGRASRPGVIGAAA